MHWWSFRDTEGKDTLFLFDSFGIIGLLGFLVENDKKIFKKIITGMQQIFKKDNEVTLRKWSFKRCNYQRLIQKELEQLSDTAFFFFRFLDEFGKYKGIENTVHVYTVDDRLQSFDTDYCEPFQLYFYLNLFESLETSMVAKAKSKKLDRKLLSELLNELFSLNFRQNKKMLDVFILERFIDFAESDTPME